MKKPTAYAKRKETGAIRAAVVDRAGGCCEACGAWCLSTGHLDHVFGRAKVRQSAANCWFLCVRCDASKTLNQPSATHWLRRFVTFATIHGYTRERDFALIKIDTLVAKGLVAA